MKKRFIIIPLIIVIIAIGAFYIYKFINNKRIKVEFDNNINVEVFSEYYNTDGIKKIKNGTVITKKELVDTSTTGEKRIELKVKDYFKKKRTYEYTVVVVDTTPPEITYKEKLSVTEGNKIDLLKGVSAKDNYDSDIKVLVEGEYDLNAPKTYELYYVASDNSKNETRVKFTLEVNKKKVVEIPEEIKLEDQTFTTSTGHTGVIKNGITYIDGILIANKTYPLPSSYRPGLQSVFSENFNRMKADAASVGISIWIDNAFRSYNDQKAIYTNYVKRDGQEKADTYSARPGHSEHQAGLAADINTSSSSRHFENTEEYKWLQENCYKYGFIERYPNGKQSITGYKYEPWHYRYVGVDLATKLYNNGNWITIEEYFGITSKYAN